MSDTEDTQQIPIHKLETVTSKYGLKTSTSKTKTMEIQVRSKIVINSNVIEQINTFIYPHCSISQQNEKDSTAKISKFLQLMEIINRTLKPSQVPKHTRMKICKFGITYFTIWMRIVGN